MQGLLAIAIAVVVAAAAGGCNGEECGPGSAGDAIVVGEADTVLTFGGLESLAGNDCVDPEAPAGVIALAIGGTQIDEGSMGRITLCVPRPDLLMEPDRTLGTVRGGDVRIIDLKGTHAGCSYTFDDTRPPTGTATATGVCKNGTDPAGFALVLDGKFSMERTCGAVKDTIGVTMVGTVEVTHRDQ